jgi:regulator of sirC expression with transglutaminase-like and TPR domain
MDIAALGLLDDEAIALDVAALQLASLDHPDVAIEPYADSLADIAERLSAVGGEARGPEEQAAALIEVFAGELGFTGDRITYDDPDNADLIRVMDRRRGLPVSLAILYVAAARRVGWAADALNTPGHVLIRIGSEIEPLLLDPFNDGAIVGPEQVAALLAGALGPGATPVAEHLASMSNRTVLVRLLLNQATRAEAGGEGSRALTLFERMTTVAPDNGHGWWERARLELVHGDLSAARASLSAMLEITRDPTMRAHVYATLEALPRSSD